MKKFRRGVSLACVKPQFGFVRMVRKEISAEIWKDAKSLKGIAACVALLGEVLGYQI